MTTLTLFRSLPLRALRPVPVGVYRPVLRLIARRISEGRPRLFARLGPHSQKSFLICPTNLPFVLLLKPDAKNPEMTPYRDAEGLAFDAKITGSFLHLLRLLDGRCDGDAIFFSRELRVEGDTEAVVSLRNALDDVEGSIAEDVAAIFGPFGLTGLSLLRRIGI